MCVCVSVCVKYGRMRAMDAHLRIERLELLLLPRDHLGAHPPVTTRVGELPARRPLPARRLLGRLLSEARRLRVLHVGRGQRARRSAKAEREGDVGRSPKGGRCREIAHLLLRRFQCLERLATLSLERFHLVLPRGARAVGRRG